MHSKQDMLDMGWSAEDVRPSLKPPLKWAGGKRWLAPRIEDIFLSTACGRLVEPFAGGMSVTLHIRPKDALLNDINPHLYNFYIWLRRGLSFSLEYRNDEESYYKARETFNNNILDGNIDSEEMAMLFYYLNRTGFNGLCRFNSKGLFNVPFGRYKNINYKEDFREYSEALSGFEITNLDFEEVDYKDGDFIYYDPPYDTPFTSYSQENFRWDDQVRLVEHIKRSELPALVSNQATSRIMELYQDSGFHIELIDAPRRISCTGDRSSVKEILAMKGVHGKR